VFCNKFKKSAAVLFTAFLAIGLILCAPKSYAKSNYNDFSRAYGLIVHNNNSDSSVPRIKALEVLLKYFTDIKKDIKKTSVFAFKDVPRSINYVNKGCQLKLFDCAAENFYPDQTISQKDFLRWFFALKYHNDLDYLKKKHPSLQDDYSRDWLEARSLNLFSGSELTYKTFQDFLYRNNVVEQNLNQPFGTYQVIELEKINAENYHNLKEMDFIENNLKKIIDSLEAKNKMTMEESDYVKNTQKKIDAFEELKESLEYSPYILNKYQDLAPEMTQIIKDYALQDILFSYSYDYSKNAAYRKHNLVTGIMKMNGKVFMPGEIMDYWKIMSDKKLSDFQYGWVIADGGEKWQFGGGICGSSSMAFLPAWKAGLEIVERNNHSTYYKNLYPIEYIGLDAAVYRPRPNLKIKNNTDSPIVFKVTNDTKKQIITVDIIGNKFYKNINIEGPIFMKKNYVKWIRHYEDFDGKITSDALESRYNAIY
jgi:vancomycin resistance protein YoaR